MDTVTPSTAQLPSDAPLARLLAPEIWPEQPPLHDAGRCEISAVVASLALGGAERIVLDWAAGCAARYRVRLFVLREARAEWPVPSGVQVMRLPGKDQERELQRCGAEIAAGGNPVALCHLLTAAERRALARGGARPVPVLHNAAAGWPEAADAVADAPWTIAVSRDAARSLRSGASRVPCAVVHHIPRTPIAHPDARRDWRTRWALPHDASVLGMIGAVKPQKSYTRALRVLAALLERRDAWLVIVGGPVGRDGLLAWCAVLAQAQRLGVAKRVRLPGFVPGAADCLPAFDVVLNTSRYEGLSIATLEALAAGLPVVASEVGGQGEIPAPGLALVPVAASDELWAGAVDR
ncbi:MAG TPA: glycosyltransferase, partial [Burkholderiales bacterium]|nr:glycosyltransferase [Burkholderiales bacterium]